MCDLKVCVWQAGPPTLTACQAAATQLAPAACKAIVQDLRVIARCLAFRQLLARALVAEGLRALPHVIQGMSAACTAAGGGPRVHVCDCAGLPRPTCGVDGLLCDVRDPLGDCIGLESFGVNGCHGERCS